MQIKRGILLRGPAPVWVPHTLRAYRCTRFFLNLDIVIPRM